MSFFGQLVSGITTYKKAHEFIQHHKLWGYVILPGMLNLIILFTISMIAYYFSSDILKNVYTAIGYEHSIDSSWYHSIINIFLKIIVWGIFIFLYISLYKYIVLIMMAPVLAFLSERTEQLLTKKEFYFNTLQFLKDVLRSIAINLCNLLIEIGVGIILFFFVNIPIIGLFTPLIGILTQSYFTGFGMLDYYCERHQMNLKQSYRFINFYKGIAIGNGFIFYSIMLIPFVGILIAPAYSVTAATIAIWEAENKM